LCTKQQKIIHNKNNFYERIANTFSTDSSSHTEMEDDANEEPQSPRASKKPTQRASKHQSLIVLNRYHNPRRFLPRGKLDSVLEFFSARQDFEIIGLLSLNNGLYCNI
jgi:hypothetical protein